MTNTARPAQVDYLKDLLANMAKHDVERARNIWAVMADHQASGTLTAELVSANIDAVKSANRVYGYVEDSKGLVASTQRVEIPQGRYALRDAEDEGKVRFYYVKRYESGAVLVYAQAGDDDHRLAKSAMRAVLQGIADAGITESLALYGQEIGVCGVCGRTLTDDESRARGIGPTCASKL